MAIGLQVPPSSGGPREAVEWIAAAEAAGVEQVWLTQAPVGPDALGVLAAAATRTTDVLLGTSVVPIFSRHPLVTASQAFTVADLSGGRLRLGLGTSHSHLVQDTHGVPFDRPQARMREYLHIVRQMLTLGEVAHDGRYWSAHASGPATDVPILVGALGERGFRLAGEIADGAIPWLCPAGYLHDVARPALEAGARAAGRRVPPLLAHVLVAPSADRESARAAAMQRIAANARMPFYARMLERAGVPVNAPDGPGRAADALLICGDPDELGQRLQALLASGFDELLVSPIFVGDETREWQLLSAVIGGLAHRPVRDALERTA